MEFTEKILQIMDKRGITAYEICKNLNISNTTFSSWKKGSKPSIDKAVEILRYLQLSADEIFEIKNSKVLQSEDEAKLLEYFRCLTERDKIKELTRLETIIEECYPKPNTGKSSESKIG
ncbi:helix-turn-helix transcriptional regulator [Lachnospiraceae bacterium 54-53]